MGKKNRSTVNVTMRTIRYSVPMLIMCLFFDTCVRDDDLTESVTALDGQPQLSLTVRMPQLSVPASAATRAQTEDEMYISTLSVLIFTYDGGEYRFSYRVAGSETSPEGNYQRFNALVLSADDPLKVIVVANAADAFNSYDPVPGTAESDVREQLTLEFPATGLTGFLPMYGEALLPDGLAAGQNNVTITALRAVARVDVVKDLELGSPEFIMEEVYVYRINDKIRIIPDELPDPSIPRVESPSIPADASFLSNPVSITVAGGTDAIQQLYVSESYAAVNDEQRLNGTTVIVVGGRFMGADNPVTYYRADFDPDLTGDYWGQTLRNYRYTFNIKEVKAPGWSDPLTAANSLATSIVIELKEWEDFSSDIYFGENRFALSSREIWLPFITTRQRQLDVESSIPYQIQWLGADGQPTGDATSEIDVTISNGTFDAAIVKEASDIEAVTHLRFTTLNDNYLGDVVNNRLRVTVDNWSVDIDVNQENPAVYSNYHISVLSGYTTAGGFAAGQLGTTVILPTWDGALTFGGLAMRKILDVQFAPNGYIKIGNFYFDQYPDSSTSLNATTPANLSELNRLLPMFDVIYLSYNVHISTPAASLVLAWLREDSRRVLIVNSDSATTNASLLNQLLADGTWSFTINSGNYTAIVTSPESDDFFAGPFGLVNTSTQLNREDTYAGYCTNPGANVLPLYRAANGYMVIGINKTDRIVYIGDANLFLSGVLSNNDGNVSTDADRFVANLWTWITAQVIYGDD